MIEKIIGRSIEQTFPPSPAVAALGAPVLGVRDLSVGAKLSGVGLDLHRGEILGIAGLQGMGQQDLFLACFGMAELARRQRPRRRPRRSGLARPPTPSAPTSRIGLVPEDRKTEALFLNLDGRTNGSIPVVSRFTRSGLIDAAAEAQAVGSAFDAVEVDRRAIWARVGAFSGGNQQKIAIARWLVAESRILLLFDPTRGIDVGTKHELYQMMRDYVDAGGSILFHSTEIPELVHLSDRVLVLYDGRFAAELTGAGDHRARDHAPRPRPRPTHAGHAA